MKNDKRVVAAWSGGIDSTAVIAQLLRRGYDVTALVFDIYREKMPAFCRRETQACIKLLPGLESLSSLSDGHLETRYVSIQGFIWAFSSDGVEIPRRNRILIDWMIARECIPRGIRNLALGEYVGADTWVVQDHIGAADCDHRSLSAYLLREYGLSYRLISLQDFGESRFKSDRLRMLINATSLEIAALTTNCLRDLLTHCGKCYKCIERAVAYEVLGEDDPTSYRREPQESDLWPQYVAQMTGGPNVSN